MTFVYQSGFTVYGAVQTQINHTQKCSKLNLTIVVHSRQALVREVHVTMARINSNTVSMMYVSNNKECIVYRRIVLFSIRQELKM